MSRIRSVFQVELPLRRCLRGHRGRLAAARETARRFSGSNREAGVASMISMRGVLSSPRSPQTTMSDSRSRQSPQEFLAYLRSLHIEITAEGEQLRLSAPRGLLTADLKERCVRARTSCGRCCRVSSRTTRPSLRFRLASFRSCSPLLRPAAAVVPGPTRTEPADLQHPGRLPVARRSGCARSAAQLGRDRAAARAATDGIHQPRR